MELIWDDHGEMMGILQGWKYYGGIIAMTLQIDWNYNGNIDES